MVMISIIICYVRNSNPISPLPIIYLPKNNNQMGFYEFSIKKKVKKKGELSKAMTLTFILLTKNGVEIKTKRMSLTRKNLVVSFN